MSTDKADSFDEAAEFRALQRLGFEMRDTHGGYSEQPDSGGVIGGKRGKQEYGIHTNADALGLSSQLRDLENEFNLSDPLVYDSEQADELSEIEEHIAHPDDRYLRAVIRSRLKSNPHFSARDFSVDSNNGDIVVRGAVDSHASKILIEEIVSSLPGVRSLTNLVRINLG